MNVALRLLRLSSPLNSPNMKQRIDSIAGIGLIALLLGVLLFLPTHGVQAAPTFGFHSDDFNDPNLDTGLWALVDPGGDASIAIIGAGTGEAYLRMTVPGGASHDAAGKNRSERVMQAVADADFEVEAKFFSLPAARYQMQGLLVQANERNWLRFDVHHDGSTLRVHAATVRNGKLRNKIDQPIDMPVVGSIWLKVRREGRTWLFSYSEDGVQWRDAGRFNHASKVQALGVFAGNHQPRKGHPAPAFTAEVDYVRNTARIRRSEDATWVPDSQPPLIHAVREVQQDDRVHIDWATDELAVGAVRYGAVDGGELVDQYSHIDYTHSVILSDLQSGVVYRYTIEAVDLFGHISRTEEGRFSIRKEPTSEVKIDIWYGHKQLIGHHGDSQRWVNVLGRVMPRNRTRSLTYSLNGGPSVRLRLGPDGRRLASSGDFNAEISVGDLQPGENEVTFTARDSRSGVTTETVLLNYQPDQTGFEPLTVTWAALKRDAEIQRVAQVVDGRWTLSGDKLRIAETGYDHLVAIGDRQWRDYQVEVPITIHNLGSRYGIGVVMRWDGHTDDPVVTHNPASGWLPLGAIGWFHNGRLAISGNRWRVDPRQLKRPVVGATYMFKMQVETQANGRPVYRLKVWLQGKPEPQNWDVVAHGRRTDPLHGSLLLIAHRTDASFGPVKITPLP